MQYPRDLQEEKDNAARLNNEAYQSRDWTTAHVRLGEMQVGHHWCGHRQLLGF